MLDATSPRRDAFRSLGGAPLASPDGGTRIFTLPRGRLYCLWLDVGADDGDGGFDGCPTKEPAEGGCEGMVLDDKAHSRI